jgi:hypothetical protein
MHTGDPLFVRAEFEQLLREYWQRSYAASKQDTDFQERFLEAYEIEVSRDRARQPWAAIPPSVHEAHDYYLNTVEKQDWGSVRLYRVPVDRQPVYAVRVTTDGDDGWMELYDEQGTELGVGRTYLELIAWGDRATIRGEVENGEFPPELSDRDTRTLWGK